MVSYEPGIVPQWPILIPKSVAVAEKIDDSNYLQWKQQGEIVIKSCRLHRFIVNQVTPPLFLKDDDRRSGKINPTSGKK